MPIFRLFDLKLAIPGRQHAEMLIAESLRPQKISRSLAMCQRARKDLCGSVRIVFSGDTKQIQSVEAGDALRILERESRLKSISLTQVQRQTARDYREAIEAFRRDPAIGFERLEAIGAVRQVA